MYHHPVLLKEVLDYLVWNQDGIYFDVTLGDGGYTLGLMERLSEKGFVYGVDRDWHMIARAEERLKNYFQWSTIYANFKDIRSILREKKLSLCDGIVADLGVASFHFDSFERGFSIQGDEVPLDMRLDPQRNGVQAFQIVNRYSEEELSDIFFKYGQEPLAKKIANRIVYHRQREKISTNRQLADLVRSVYFRYRRFRSRRHPATRVFQALRIEVNQEMQALDSFLKNSVKCLKDRGVLVVVSYHSLEDRLVKHVMRSLCQKTKSRLLTKKAIQPSVQEIRDNPRARSAKMRVLEYHAV